MKRPYINLDTITLDCDEKHVPALMDFYSQLAGFQVESLDGEFMPTLLGQHIAISFQPVDGYQRPTFPTEERGQQIHLDFFVEDLEEAVAYAKSIGAQEAQKQFGDSWHILLDPAGHTFCLTLNGPTPLEFRSETEA